MGHFDSLWEKARPAFDQERTWARARTLALSSLVALGRRTITGLLTTSAQQDVDWSQAYRLFEQDRFDVEALFAPARRELASRLPKEHPLVVAMDDTLLRKRGKKVHGTGWKRDPLGPAFHTNLVWGQRFLQLAAALPEGEGACRCRTIPIDMCHAPSPRKPRKTADDQAWATYRQQQHDTRIGVVGARRLNALRTAMDSDTENADRTLIAVVDGSFSNREVFRKRPKRSILIGRIRKDARLYAPPEEQATQRGRRRFYGKALPTPEQIRQDASIPWTQVIAWGGGTRHRFDIKTLACVRWRSSGEQDLRLVVIRPLAYRPRKGAHLLYREPAYLLCTDPKLPLEKLLQYYIWRWEIELNFRDEKTLLGVGEAQVWTETAVKQTPAFLVAAYAFLLLAATQRNDAPSLPPPKWRRDAPTRRRSTAEMIGQLRAELWGKGMGLNKNKVVQHTHHNTKPVLIENALPQAVCYAFR